MKILTLSGIFQYTVGLFMYKFVKGMLPDLFDNVFHYVSQVHAHFTRNSLGLFVPFSRTSRGQKVISYTGPCIWNVLSAKLDTDCAIGTFKKSLRTFCLK